MQTHSASANSVLHLNPEQFVRINTVSTDQMDATKSSITTITSGKICHRTFSPAI